MLKEMPHPQTWALSQDANKPSGQCSVCREVRQLHPKNGTVHSTGHVRKPVLVQICHRGLAMAYPVNQWWETRLVPILLHVRPRLCCQPCTTIRIQMLFLTVMIRFPLGLWLHARWLSTYPGLPGQHVPLIWPVCSVALRHILVIWMAGKQFSAGVFEFLLPLKGAERDTI